MMQEEAKATLRARIYLSVFVKARDRRDGLSLFNKILAVIILLSLSITVLETEDTLFLEYSSQFYLAELLIAFIFAIEFTVRIWAASEETEFQGWGGKVRFLFKFNTIIDMCAFLPTLLIPLGIDVLGSSAFMLRLARLSRLGRFAGLGRYSRAIRNIENALKSCRKELTVCIFIALGMILLGATVLYWIEGEAQPETFGSIPRALWWSAVTLTTVGYGDVAPITVFGKLAASMVALVGVATVALPAGIIAGAFQEAVRESKEGKQ